MEKRERLAMATKIKKDADGWVSEGGAVPAYEYTETAAVESSVETADGVPEDVAAAKAEAERQAKALPSDEAFAAAEARAAQFAADKLLSSQWVEYKRAVDKAAGKLAAATKAAARTTAAKKDVFGRQIVVAVEAPAASLADQLAAAKAKVAAADAAKAEVEKIEAAIEAAKNDADRTFDDV